ncbi:MULTISPECIES: ABC transporter ATP-binding protein [unclassified Streptomyces]|uniref:ABC transporter ATP-binding protein n=1 Tax=unclassified Streptomyces TaxID=2593676 RepID=UPI00202EB340|nr:MULTISPECIES: ATP-binding cassette domain-containing protein [unclassified Streptomyces]MCM1967484.1 ATP-binding cassette domain-containing protein [Streptomyces sp. G1]MCX5296700.1 ATP-binding cassette domain-containing protein [Streptomyces sp. NBC_00193]
MDDFGIHATALTKSYGALRVLDGIGLAVPRGSVLALLGPNGAGKTTTVRILATLTEPDSGTARVAGHDTASERTLVRRSISLTGQFAAVDDLQTGAEMLRMVGRLRGLRPRAARARADELLERFGLAEAAGRTAKSYSGGMRRRLDLAASLVARPEVIFLDEPTAGLDPRSRQELWELVRELRADGTSVLLTTQYLEEADRLADRVAVLSGGRIAAEGTPAELKSRVAGHRLDLTLASRAAYDALAPRAALLAAGEGAAPAQGPAGSAQDLTLTPEELGLSLPTDGSAAHVRSLLDALDPDHTAVDRFSVRGATLDDVFLTLTGAAP